MTQLIYLSRATQTIDRAELTQIAAVSSANNARVNVTGALLYCNGYFLQVLEGAEDALNVLLEKIGEDRRHVDVQVIQRRKGIAREFANWAMAGVHWETMAGDEKARAAQCIAMISDPELVDRIGNDAHHLLLDLQTAIADAA
jgi:hypothetical protein